MSTSKWWIRSTVARDHYSRSMSRLMVGIVLLLGLSGREFTVNAQEASPPNPLNQECTRKLADEPDYRGGHTAKNGAHIDQPAVTASHGLVVDSRTGPSPPAGAHPHAMPDIRAEFDQALAAARTAGENQRADAGEEIVSAGGAQVGYGGLAGGTAWVVADDQTAAPQHMAGGYDTA